MLSRSTLALLVLAACEARNSPEVTLLEPHGGATASERDAVGFLAVVEDRNGTNDLAHFAWTSDRDGLLLEGGRFSEDGVLRLDTRLTPGTHTVTLTVRDRADHEGRDRVRLMVTPFGSGPSAAITSLPALSSFDLGGDLPLTGTVADPDHDADALSVEWTATLVTGGPPILLADGPVDPSGLTTAVFRPETLGRFRIVLGVEDPDGQHGEAEVLVQVVDALDHDADEDGWTPRDGDCDDRNDQVFPGAPELCGNGSDDDCNAVEDDRDRDADGHVDDACAATTGAAAPADDCDDLDASVFPGAPEAENGLDDDCDGDPDDGTPAWDADGDCFCPGATCSGSTRATCSALAGLDCDDAAADRFPGATEVCNDLDDDCDAVADDGLAGVFYWPDGDGDGAGDAAGARVRTCDGPPAGHVANADDCDDASDLVHPGVPEVVCDAVDNDCDPATSDGPDADGDGSPACLDCDDADPGNRPGGVEVCDRRDNDCSGTVDENAVQRSWFPDQDRDGFGDIRGDAVVGCAPVAGHVTDGRDCDDLDDTVHPGALEVTCDGVENDCDLATPDAPDLDLDGASACEDCDDADPYQVPGGVELCDGQDNTCDGLVDEAVVYRDWWPDADGDGHGDPAGIPVDSCSVVAGHALAPDDCDDGDPDRFPGHAEACDGRDQDCDPEADEGLVFASWWPDLDGDGWGDAVAGPTVTCDGPPVGSDVTNGLDCDDSDPAVNPGAAEIGCNGADDDCLAQTEDDPDEDLDGVPRCSECDDGDPDNFPGNPEVCDGRDNDCAGGADDGLAFTDWFPDADTDGYGDGGGGAFPSCAAAVPGRVANGADCDDGDFDVNPGYPELTCDGVDNDCRPTTPDQPDGDGDGSTVCTDCRDDDAAVHPGAVELCDGLDNDCALGPDDGLLFLSWWPDDDLDTYGADGSLPVTACAPPAGRVANHADCDDVDPDAFPGQAEVCDGIDQDCDGSADDGLVFDTWYPDGDGDGFGEGGAAGRSTCDGPPAGHVAVATDCDDTLPSAHPGGTEVPADGVDQDCDGGELCWVDADGDGVGTPVATTGTLGCTGPQQSLRSDDCDDADADDFPGNPERCDGVDNDCDGTADDDIVFADTWPDADGDGFGDGSQPPVNTCSGPASGYAASGTDCDDGAAAVHPGAPESTCNGADDDCDPGTPDAPDADGDGAPSCADCDDADPGNRPGNPEVCDDVDNDCDGLPDDGLAFVTTWVDADGDGWGDPGSAPLTGCAPPADRVDNDLDCDDGDPAANRDDLDADSWSTCDGDCGDDRGDTFPGAPDVPDGAFADEDCDGLDGNGAAAVFVATTGSDVANFVCSSAAPCRTLDRAVDVAGALGLAQVYVQAGTYLGGVLADRDVALFGGFDTGWTRAPNATPGHTAILVGGFVAEDGEHETVRVRGVDVGLHDLQIEGPDATSTDGASGRSSYAIHADDTSNVIVERCVIVQGAGADGLVGVDGGDAAASAAAGADGQDGADGGGFATCDTSQAPAGLGGTNATCSDTGGGRGGRGGRSDLACCGATCDAFCGDCTPQRGAHGADGAQTYAVPAGAYWYRTVDDALVPTSPVELVAATEDVTVVPPDSAALPDGFAVLWIDNHGGTVPDATVRLTTYRGAPMSRTLDLVLANVPNGTENRPSVDADSTGRMAAAWHEYLDVGPTTVVLAFLDADGTFLMPPFRASNDADYIVVEFLDDDHVAVAWEAPVPGGFGLGIYTSVWTFPEGSVVYPPTLVSDATVNAERPAITTRDDGGGRWRMGLSWEQTTAIDPERTVHGVVVGYQL